MADKFKVRIDTSDLVKLNRKIVESTKLDKRDWNKVGKVTVSAMLRLISSGVSPIRGKGKFPSYKTSYKKIRLSKGKAISPVDLNLSGKFLKSLKSTPFNNSVNIAYKGKLSNDKESGHRKGTNKQKKRPTIPQGSEKFAVTISNAISKILVSAISKRLKKI